LAPPDPDGKRPLKLVDDPVCDGLCVVILHTRTHFIHSLTFAVCLPRTRDDDVIFSVAVPVFCVPTRAAARCVMASRRCLLRVLTRSCDCSSTLRSDAECRRRA
jgi:hypothetical protein